MYYKELSKQYIKQDEIVYEQSCEIFTEVSHSKLISIMRSLRVFNVNVFVFMCVTSFTFSSANILQVHITALLLYVCCQHEELLEMIQGTFNTYSYMQIHTFALSSTHIAVLGSQPQMNNSKKVRPILCVRNSRNVIVIDANLT